MICRNFAYLYSFLDAYSTILLCYQYRPPQTELSQNEAWSEEGSKESRFRRAKSARDRLKNTFRFRLAYYISYIRCPARFWCTTPYSKAYGCGSVGTAGGRFDQLKCQVYLTNSLIEWDETIKKLWIDLIHSSSHYISHLICSAVVAAIRQRNT